MVGGVEAALKGAWQKDFIQDDEPLRHGDLRRFPGSGLEGRHRQGERARVDW